jgi:uncharacterized protein YndB with AHSA1/START domain
VSSGALVKLERLVPAPPAVVFQAWLDPAALARFMCPAEGATVTRAETDPRVGGRFLIVMQVGGRDRPHQGEYRVIDPPARLVFTWESEVAPPDSEVTLTFEEAVAGQTLLTLIHRGLPAAAQTSHQHGWTHILATLAANVA